MPEFACLLIFLYFFVCVCSFLGWKANKHFPFCVIMLPVKVIFRDYIFRSAPLSFAPWANAAAVRRRLDRGSAPAGFSPAQVSEVRAGSRRWVRAPLSIPTCAWRTSPEQVLCTSVSLPFQSSSPKQHRGIVESFQHWGFSSAFQTFFFLHTKHLFSINTTFIFGYGFHQATHSPVHSARPPRAVSHRVTPASPGSVPAWHFRARGGRHDTLLTPTACDHRGPSGHLQLSFPGICHWLL